MKKFFKFASLALVVAFVGLFGLAGCGEKDEFANAKEISSEEFSAYMASEEVVTEFTGYTMTVSVMGGMMTLNADVALVGEDLQAAMNIETTLEEVGNKAMYLKNNVVYVDAGEAGKYKMAYDESNSNLDDLKDSLKYVGDLTSMLEEKIQTKGVVLKNVQEGNQNKFLIEITSDVLGESYVYSMKLIYENNQLIEFVEITTINSEEYSRMSVKATNKAVAFPEGLETDESYESQVA